MFVYNRAFSRLIYLYEYLAATVGNFSKGFGILLAATVVEAVK